MRGVPRKEVICRNTLFQSPNSVQKLRMTDVPLESPTRTHVHRRLKDTPSDSVRKGVESRNGLGRARCQRRVARNSSRWPHKVNLKWPHTTHTLAQVLSPHCWMGGGVLFRVFRQQPGLFISRRCLYLIFWCQVLKDDKIHRWVNGFSPNGDRGFSCSSAEI